MLWDMVNTLLSRYAPLSQTPEKDIQLPLRHDTGDLESIRDHSPAPYERQNPRLVDPRIISDAIIGLSDGMTVPFALTAGLSTLDDTRVVVFGGLAELIAGAISMGLGGYLGARSEELDCPALSILWTRQRC
jgi:vacuolar iron transporter family protein